MRLLQYLLSPRYGQINIAELSERTKKTTVRFSSGEYKISR
jgi:hypothetical protein